LPENGNGRTLDFDDLEHYAKVVSVLTQTIELMQKLML
jgi:hypothetical protein